MSTVGFVGAGRMGAPMVERLVQAGHDVRVLARTPQKGADIEELGASPVAGVTALAEDADVVVVCVFTDEQVREVCVDDGLLAAMPAGSVLVVHTTGSPTTAGLLAARAPEVAVVDAPVSGGPHDIAAGHITLFVGGEDAAVERARSVLAAYGDPILHMGGLGAGQWMKLINNTLFAAQLGMLSEAAAFAARVGVDETALLDALGHGSGASRAAEIVGTRGSVRSFIDSVGEFLGKDVAVVREVAAETGADLGALEGLLDTVVATPSGGRPRR